MFSDKEKMLEGLYRYSNNRNQLIFMRFSDGRALIVKPDTWYTDENDFDESDERYEEWESGVFMIEEVISDPSGKLSPGNLIEVTYKDYPIEIHYEYQKIYKIEEADNYSCPQCEEQLIKERCGAGVTYTCPKCGWSVASTEFYSIDLDNTQYKIRLAEGTPVSKESLSLVSHMTGKNFIESKEIIENCKVIFVGKAREIVKQKEYLTEQGVAFVIEPDFPY